MKYKKQLLVELLFALKGNLFAQGCFVNGVFGKLQLLSSLLDRILAAHALCHQLLHPGLGICRGGGFFLLLGRTGNYLYNFSLGGLLGL